MRFNPIQARGHFLPPSPISQHISKTAWSFELLLGELSFYVYFFQKSSVPPISPHECCHGNHATFWHILKTRITNVFQVFPPGGSFLWENLLCFRHNNTLRSIIIANIRTVTMEKFQKVILPKYGHRH